jgi:hypothetical protein
MGNSRFVGEYYHQQGLRLPAFHNGQLLTAEDLRAEQSATWERLSQLGSAAGAGIMTGLEVERASSYQVFVNPGLGINRAGDIVELAGNGVTLTINVSQTPGVTSTSNGRFQDCALSTAGSQPINEGAYLLTAVPTSRPDGSVPLKASPGKSSLPACAAQWDLAGVQFKAIRLDGVNLIETSANRRRNLLAHWCYGTTALKTMPHRPFQFPTQFTGLDLINAADLTPCDLPLAVFYWTANGIAFVDNWSARRRFVLPYPASAWEVMVSDRRVARSQAVFLQFQEHLAGLSNLPAVVATQRFRYLPPVCFLPAKPPTYVLRSLIRDLLSALYAVTGDDREPSDSEITLLLNEVQATLDASPNYGVTLATFFGNQLPDRVGLIERETVEYRLNHSWYDEPIDLDVLPRFHLHIVAENVLLYIAAVLLQYYFRLLAELSDLPPGSVVDVSTLPANLQYYWFLVRTLIVQALTGIIRLDPPLVEAAISTPDTSLLYVMVVKAVEGVHYLDAPKGQTAPSDATTGGNFTAGSPNAQPVGMMMMAGHNAPAAIGSQPVAMETPQPVVEMANILVNSAANPNLAVENPEHFAILNTMGMIRRSTDTP